MRRFLISVLIFLAAPVLAWEPVGDGIEYQAYTIAEHPNNIFVTRLDRHNPNAVIASTLAYGSYKARQTVSEQLKANDDRAFFDGKDWGTRYKMVAGINADFFMMDDNGRSVGLRVSDGFYSNHITGVEKTVADPLALPHTPFAQSAFCWTSDRNASMWSSWKDSPITVNFENGKSLSIINLNSEPAENTATMYNLHYGLKTPKDDIGVKALISLNSPNVIGQIGGKIKAVGAGGEMIIPFDCVVISARGDAAKALLESARVGSDMNITTSINAMTSKNEPISSGDFANALAILSGAVTLIEDGIIIEHNDFKMMTDLYPRTTVAYNDDYIYFIVCDGRAKGVSRGMTGIEISEFCRDSLNVKNAVSLDGGGSATMVVNGAVKNKPSDGKERTVPTAFVMANVKPKEFSADFYPGQMVVINTEGAELRRGFGAINPTIVKLKTGATGKITAHRLGGILSQNAFWWEVDFNGTCGWVNERYIKE